MKEFLEANGYTNIRRLSDGSWSALLRLAYTTAICMGLDETAWRHRYCFESKGEAESELEKMQRVDDVPTGWIARR